MHIEIASIIFEICIVPEPATTSGTGLLLERDTGYESRMHRTRSLGSWEQNGSSLQEPNIEQLLLRYRFSIQVAGLITV